MVICMARTAELILGLLGGIIGLVASVAALFIGGMGSVFHAEGASQIVSFGWLALLASIVGIVGAVFVKSKTKFAGWLMIISAVVGLISIYLFYIIPTILLGIAGLMALRKGN